MIEKIKILAALVEAERAALDVTDLDLVDLDVTLTAHVAHCMAYVREFNSLEPDERFKLLTKLDADKRPCWDTQAVAIAIYAIGHSFLDRDPQPFLGQTIDHMTIDDEPATIVTTVNGERLSFDNFPEFGEAHFTNNFPLHDEAAVASKHIAMMCRGLGRIW